jgi:hypothetical protein
MKMKRWREGVLEEATLTLSSDDPELQGSLAEFLEAIKQHVLDHGAVAGLPDFLEKAGHLADRFADNSLAANTARQLAREVRVLRRALDAGSDPNALYVGVRAGLAYASLVLDQHFGNKVNIRVAAEEAFAAKRHVGTRKKTDEEIRAVQARHLTISEEARKLGVSETTAKNYRRKFRQG